MLSEQGIDFAGVVEKSELQGLWQRFSQLRQRTLADLQAACREHGGPTLATVGACARFLVAPPARVAPNDANPTHAAAPSAAPAAAEHGREEAAQSEAERLLRLRAELTTEPDCGPSAAQEQAARREDAAQTEVDRILRLRRNDHWSTAAWGFSVLGIAAERTTASVAKAYRGMMKVLHPDKVGQSQQVVKALELVKEAKDVCERSLSSLEAPSAPRNLKSSCTNATKGKRKFRLTWQPPASAISERCPVRRYVVAAFDPAYGRALTVTNLEPDYSEELKRFVSVEELTSFELAEEELQKMPRLWEQPFATIQVASANEAGQSQWATLQVPLTVTAADVGGGGAAAGRRLGTRKRGST